MAGRYNNRHGDTRNKGTTYTKTRISPNKTGKRRLQKEVKLLPKRIGMAGTQHITRWNQTEQRKNGCNQQIEPTDKYKNPKIIFGRNTIFCEIQTKSIRKDGQYETTTEKKTKWEWTEERNTELNNLKKELTTQPRLAHYNGNKENIVTTDTCNTGLGIALWQRQHNGELKAIA